MGTLLKFKPLLAIVDGEVVPVDACPQPRQRRWRRCKRPSSSGYRSAVLRCAWA